MAIVSVTLDEKQKMWLEQIILDEDKDEALRFLKECIYEKIKGQGQDQCGPPF
jgi:hypothetical protein